MIYTFIWGNNAKRASLKGRNCRIVARGHLKSALVEFENGEREIVSQRALRPAHDVSLHTQTSLYDESRAH